MELRNEDVFIILLCGKARCGKDTVMSYLKDKYESNNKKVINLQFSSYIKEYAKRISDWDGSDETKPRELLQVLGTDIIRNKIDNLFFINRIIDDIKVYKYFFDIIIISDVRFPIEIEEIKKNFNNVVSIHINRDDSNNLTDKEKLHITEVALDNYNNYDYVINNNSSVQELYSKIDELNLREE